ncbi:hypothetical protein E4U30_002611 [Claviceps sp. LM220 group G6]|nr:hypothetical protein E4U30_002611 [Claviceps sp. LM220 group G6]
MGFIGDFEGKANTVTVLYLVPFDEKQASQIGIPQKFTIGFVGFRAPASCLTLLDRDQNGKRGKTYSIAIPERKAHAASFHRGYYGIVATPVARPHAILLPN